MPINAEVLTGLGGLLTGIAALLVVYSDRKKRQSEANNEDCNAAQQLSESAVNLTKRFEALQARMDEELSERDDRIEKLEKKVTETNQRWGVYVRYLLSGIERLSRQIVEKHNDVPCFKPKDLSQFDPEKDIE